MRETIDFGIDLGTTNSAIAVAEDDGVRVIKNNDGWDCTPSAVWMPKEGVIHVGRRARERTEDDPENAYAEFKLEMGAAGAAGSAAPESRSPPSSSPPRCSSRCARTRRTSTGTSRRRR